MFNAIINLCVLPGKIRRWRNGHRILTTIKLLLENEITNEMRFTNLKTTERADRLAYLQHLIKNMVKYIDIETGGGVRLRVLCGFHLEVLVFKRLRVAPRLKPRQGAGFRIGIRERGAGRKTPLAPI